MTEQLDYIFFIYGIGFIVLAAVCFSADKKKIALPWTWLGLFGLIHGLNEWLDMLALSIGDSIPFKAARICIMVLSFICLVEFGRLGTKSIVGKGPGRWITFVLFVIGCIGWLNGWVGLNVFFRYSLGFVGGVWSAIAILLAWRHSDDSREHRALFVLGILLASYAAASGIIVPKAPFLPASILNHDLFMQIFGFPVQLLRGIIALASAICVWQALDSNRAKQSYRTVYVCSLLIILAVGWFFTNRIGISEHREWINNLQSTCTISATSINSELVKDIDSIEDLQNPHYKLLKERLLKMRQSSPEFRYIYLMVMRNGKIIFSADSEPPTSKDYSPPGDEYTDAPAELRALCHGESRSTTAEYEDKWGKWVSAFVCVRDDITGKPVAILGMDYMQTKVDAAVSVERLKIIAITLLASVLTILLLYFRERRELFIASISETSDYLRESETNFRTFFESITDIFLVGTPEGNIINANAVTMQKLGYSADELYNMHFLDLHGINKQKAETILDEILLGERNSCPLPLVAKDGSQIPVETRVWFGKWNSLDCIFSISKDLSAEQEALQKFNHIFNSNPAPMALSNSADQIFTDINNAFVNTLGYSRDEIIGHTATELDLFVEPEMQLKVAHSLQVNNSIESCELKVRCKNGTILDGLFSGKIIESQGNSFMLTVMIDLSKQKQDVMAIETAKKRIEEDAIKLVYQATHDTLTRLPNRFMFNDTLTSIVSSKRKAGVRVAVMFIDLDKFKYVNDTLGHNVGDRLLVKVSKRLRTCLRNDEDLLCRMGGDEFTVIIKSAIDTDSIKIVADRILEVLGKTFVISRHEINIGASIGVSIYPQDGADVANIVRMADTAMYKAKELGRNNCKFYSIDMDTANLERMQIERELRAALTRDEFEVHYQPRVDPLSGKVFGAEALVRWNHPVRGQLKPEEFLHVAEECGIILNIENIVITSVFTRLKEWIDAAQEPIVVTINLSDRMLWKSDFKEYVENNLYKYDIPASSIAIDVLGDSLTTANEEVLSSIQRLREKGMTVILNDFSKSPIPLADLRQMPVDGVRIDGALVCGLTNNDWDNTSIAASIIATAHNMGLEVIAVGVETQEQMELISSMMCDSIQGHLISHPLKWNAFTKFMVDKKLGDTHNNTDVAA